MFLMISGRNNGQWSVETDGKMRNTNETGAYFIKITDRIFCLSGIFVQLSYVWDILSGDILSTFITYS